MSLPTVHDSRSSLILWSTPNLIFKTFMQKWLRWPNSYLLPIIINMACIEHPFLGILGEFYRCKIINLLPIPWSTWIPLFYFLKKGNRTYNRLLLFLLNSLAIQNSIRLKLLAERYTEQLRCGFEQIVTFPALFFGHSDISSFFKEIKFFPVPHKIINPYIQQPPTGLLI